MILLFHIAANGFGLRIKPSIPFFPETERGKALTADIIGISVPEKRKGLEVGLSFAVSVLVVINGIDRR